MLRYKLRAGDALYIDSPKLLRVVQVGWRKVTVELPETRRLESTRDGGKEAVPKALEVRPT